jgi:hypothetical protein
MKILFLAVQAQYLANPETFSFLNKATMYLSIMGIFLGLAWIVYIILFKMRNAAKTFLKDNDTKVYQAAMSSMIRELAFCVIGIAFIIGSLLAVESVRRFFF